MIMMIEKGTKASTIEMYRKLKAKMGLAVLSGCNYLDLTENGFVWFIVIPNITEEEQNQFDNAKKRFGYITDNRGKSVLIAENFLATECSFFPYTHYLPYINSECCKEITVILVDGAKDVVAGIKEYVLPDEVIEGLKEQWRISISTGITHSDYNRWVQFYIYSKSPKANVARAKKLTEVKDCAKEIVLFM